MYSLIYLGVISFTLALFLTPLVRNLFRRWGMVDHPDGSRKKHDLAVPRVGGIALAAAYLLAFASLLLLNAKATSIIRDGYPTMKALGPVAALMFGVGLFDDLVGLKPWKKLAAQTVVAVLAYWAGIHVQGFSGIVFADWLSLPLTVFWIVLCTNAINLIDGVDGLAAGVSLFAAATMMLAALLQNNVALALATVPLVGVLAGFLRYNFNPATIFLGDSGSLTIGFLLGCFGVLWSQKSATILGMTAPLMALAVPLLDTCLAVMRRFLRRQPIFSGDRGHIHHKLLDRGFTPRKVSLLLYGVCAIGAMGSLFMASQHFEILIIAMFCLVVGIGIRHLGYVEFAVARRMLAKDSFRRLFNSQISLEQYEKELTSAKTPDECWKIVQSACQEFGFCEARMVLGERSFEFCQVPPARGAFEIRMPLSDTDKIELKYSATETANSGVIAPFASMLHSALVPKLPAFAPRASEETGTVIARAAG